MEKLEFIVSLTDDIWSLRFFSPLETHRSRHLFRIWWRVDGLGDLFRGFVTYGQNASHPWWRSGDGEIVHLISKCMSVRVYALSTADFKGPVQWGVGAAFPSADQGVSGLTASLRPAAGAEGWHSGCRNGGKGTGQIHVQVPSTQSKGLNSF